MSVTIKFLFDGVDSLFIYLGVMYKDLFPSCAVLFAVSYGLILFVQVMVKNFLDFEVLYNETAIVNVMLLQSNECRIRTVYLRSFV